jgi:hypothetical protein
MIFVVSLDWRPSSQYILVSVMPSCFRLPKIFDFFRLGKLNVIYMNWETGLSVVW